MLHHLLRQSEEDQCDWRSISTNTNQDKHKSTRMFIDFSLKGRLFKYLKRSHTCWTLACWYCCRTRTLQKTQERKLKVLTLINYYLLVLFCKNLVDRQSMNFVQRKGLTSVLLVIIEVLRTWKLTMLQLKKYWLMSHKKKQNKKIKA